MYVHALAAVQYTKIVEDIIMEKVFANKSMWREYLFLAKYFSMCTLPALSTLFPAPHSRFSRSSFNLTSTLCSL